MTVRAPMAVAVLLAAAGTACGGGAPGPEPSPEGWFLTVAVKADVTGFLPNPPIAAESFTLDLHRSVYEPLVRLGPEYRLEPALAERWENPDDRTYVFDLRPGTVFSDGRRLAAADVAASLLAAREGWATRDNLQAIESARALSETRVEVRTRSPYIALLPRLSWGFVLPAEALGRSPVPVIGTGPYRLDSWEPGRGFVFSRNPRFRGPRPAFERARFVVVPDDAERMAMVERGEADAADHVPPGRVEELASRRELRVVARSGPRVVFLVLRPDRAPFSDPRVREAVDLALDRAEVVRRALHDQGEPASQVVPPAIVGFVPTLAPTRPDQARARDLLRAATRPDLLLDGSRGWYAADEAIAGEVARQLGEAGVAVALATHDKATLLSRIDSGLSAAYLLGWRCDSGDAGEVLDSLVHSPSGGLGAYNTTGLRDDTLDRLIEEANRARTSADRTARLRAAVAHLARLRVVLPLVVPREAVVHSRRVAWDPPVSRVPRPETLRPAGEPR